MKDIFQKDTDQTKRQSVIGVLIITCFVLVSILLNTPKPILEVVAVGYEEVMEPLFDIIIGIDSAFKRITDQKEILAHLTLYNFGRNVTDETALYVALTYIIRDSQDKEITSTTEDKQVVGLESSFDQTIALPSEGLKPGRYSLSAEMLYDETKTASAEDSFEVVGPSRVKDILLISLIVIVVAGIIYYIWRRVLAKKQSTEP